MKNSIIFLFSIMLMCFSCNDEKTIYQIVKFTHKKPQNLIYIDVHLKNKISIDEFNKVAYEIKEGCVSKTPIFITFYTISAGNKPWAVAKFNYGFESHILGYTIEEDEVFKRINKPDYKIIGKWKDEGGTNLGFIIYQDSINTNYIKTIFKDGESIDKIVIYDKKNNSYSRSKEINTEYFIIEQNRNLGMYDKNGKFSEASLEEY